MGKRPRSPERWYVEAIMKAQRQKNTTGDITRFSVRQGGWVYFVKWAGWPDSANTWEPIENLLSCLGLITRFWHNVDGGVRTFMVNENGYIVVPNEGLVDEEKEKFVREIPNAELNAQNANPRRSRFEWLTDTPPTPSRSASPEASDTNAAAGPSKRTRFVSSQGDRKKQRGRAGKKGKGRPKRLHVSQTVSAVPVSEFTFQVPSAVTASEPTQGQESLPTPSPSPAPQHRGLMMWDGKEPLGRVGIDTKQRLGRHTIAPKIPHLMGEEMDSGNADDVGAEDGIQNGEVKMPVGDGGDTTPMGENYEGDGTLEFDNAFSAMDLGGSLYDGAEDWFAVNALSKHGDAANENENTAECNLNGLGMQFPAVAGEEFLNIGSVIF
ncbi:hypothetical protein C8F01DRAFT_745060 [Mycena amicta]|nr:hypothetical protein C8F01DRAFT_745060 [Mycena amicta]